MIKKSRAPILPRKFGGIICFNAMVEKWNSFLKNEANQQLDNNLFLNCC